MIRTFRLFFYTVLLFITVLAFIPDYSSLPPIVSISDLINHSAAFTVLYLLYSLAYAHTVRRIVFILSGYGIAIEIVQAFLPTRYASFEDIAADCGGILMGYLVLKVFRPFMGQKI